MKKSITLYVRMTHRKRAHIEHYTGDSILENFSIKMVSQIPLDYASCLIWLKMYQDDVSKVSNHLISMRAYIPIEFTGKPRGLYDVDKWKTTEFRQFLLYIEIVIMKLILSPMLYNHFICLSVAIRILIDSYLCMKFNSYANSLLLSFFDSFRISRKKFDNCVVILDDNSVIYVLDIVQDNRVISFFTVPCDEKKLCIFLVTSTPSDIIKAMRIKRKCLKLRQYDEDSFVVIPFLHANN
ncbi:hypothetical protein ACFW04_014748 [Cataglyphis niger]